MPAPTTYLTKPFGVSELLARVRALLRRNPSEREQLEPIIEFGECRIDCVHRAVTRAGEPLHLTDIQYRLLILLASNPGRVLTHRQLLLQIWGSHALENNQYLRIYVGHLRQKIERIPAQPRHIITEIGVGYRFEPELQRSTPPGAPKKLATASGLSPARRITSLNT